MNLRFWISFAIAGAALAQGPNRPQPGQPGPGRPAQFHEQAMLIEQSDFGALKMYLNLSDAQLDKMRQARAQSARQSDEKMNALAPQIEEKRLALKDMLDRGVTDPAALGKAMLEIRALEKQAQQSREAERNSQLSVLTPEQRTKFRAIEEAAALPAATRDAMRLGLVPFSPGPQPGRMEPGPGPAPGPRPR
jgi:Spy/CpxP family protein refolding chaperone